MANYIELREINKLIRENFFIPTYQRGYRWDEKQVTELLEDVYEFMHKGNTQAGEFYCLQPIVVKKRNDNRYDVIDGQQRLTTFLIIQKYLQKRTYKIEYASREGSSDFLENITDYVENGKEQANNNIDFFFMTKAYNTVKSWFETVVEENEDYTLPDEFSTYLGKYCKVIWYEVEDDADSESIFTRLNIGKIPLTNAELIKALFLRKSNFDTVGDATYLKQLEIAAEWDNIENTLQDDKVWYFINPEYAETPATRIEFIFDIISRKSGNSYGNYTFLEFVKMFEANPNAIDQVWKTIKNHFRVIMEWYEDQRLFHLIGFLTSSNSGVTVTELIEEYFSHNYKKTEFENYIVQQIKEYFDGTDIENLSYDYSYDKNEIKDILLLFNVITVMNKSSAYSRFPFDSYNKNAWSLEHIHAQNTDGMGGSKVMWLAWIDEHLKSFRQFTDEKYKEVVTKLEEIDRDKLDKETFDALFFDICLMIQDDYGVNLHSIDNLALLDKNANSSISNNFFDVKRSMIIEKDRNGEFIPVCTRNVFLKYYSEDPSQIHYWSESDRRDYLNTIKNTIAPYFDMEEEETDE